MENEIPQMPQVAVLPKYLVPLLIVSIILSVVAVGLSVYSIVDSDQEPIDVAESEIVVLDDVDDTVSTYTSNMLELSFSYPSDWTVSERSSSHGHALLEVDGSIFFSADSYPYDGGDRGAGWTDLPHSIASQETINGFCDSPLTFNGDILEIEKVEECDVLENSSGIRYAKTYQEIDSEGGSMGMAYTYYFYNPNSDDFSGIVLSSVMLNDKTDAEAEEFLDAIADSINWIE